MKASSGKSDQVAPDSENERHGLHRDAVYAHFDGYGIELRLNDHRNECAVYLEPAVLQALTKFYKRCSQPENN